MQIILGSIHKWSVENRWLMTRYFVWEVKCLQLSMYCMMYRHRTILTTFYSLKTKINPQNMERAYENKNFHFHRSSSPRIVTHISLVVYFWCSEFFFNFFFLQFKFPSRYNYIMRETYPHKIGNFLMIHKLKSQKNSVSSGLEFIVSSI